MVEGKRSVVLVAVLCLSASSVFARQLDASRPPWNLACDGRSDVTAVLQAAIDDAFEQGVCLFIPDQGKSCRVLSLDLHPGSCLLSDGATLEQLDSAGKWDRLLTFERNRYRSEEASPWTTIRGLSIDGNRERRGAYRNYEQQQSHGLFLTADPALGGRLRVALSDLEFRDTPGDAISVRTGVKLVAERIEATDCFRGGLVVHGGDNTVELRDFRFGGEEHVTGFDVEPDPGGAGHELRLANDILIEDGWIDGDFDLGARGGGQVIVRNLVSAAPPFTVEGTRLGVCDDRSAFCDDDGDCGGGRSCVGVAAPEVVISHSTIVLGDADPNRNRIVRPHDVTFEEVDFVLDRSRGATDGLPVYWKIQGPIDDRGQHLRFRDCSFTIDGAAASATRGIVSLATDESADQRLSLERVAIENRFDFGVWLDPGAVLSMEQCRIDAATPVFPTPAP